MNTSRDTNFLCVTTSESVFPTDKDLLFQLRMDNTMGNTELTTAFLRRYLFKVVFCF